MMDKLKVLIVEDDRSLLDLYDLALPDSLFDKYMVGDGVKAVEVYNSLHPDIILLDILMPGMSGCEVLREIREIFGDRSTAIVMATSVDAKGETSCCEKLGIQGYIVKPFDHKNIAYRVLEYYKKTAPGKGEEALIRLAEIRGGR
jgi:DNA-binding response OmpR family regulator